MECLSATLKEDFLTCMICLEIYSEPQTLPCLHTFCKLCLQKFVKTSGCKGPYNCPVCDETFSVDGKDVKLNFHLQSMADIVNQSKDFSQILCSYCGLLQKNEVAVSRCVTCLDFLCDTCAKSRHTFTRQTRNHKIVSLSDIKTGMYDNEIRSRQKMRCPKHVYETLQMYCIKCDLCVCVECVVLDHKQHALQSLSEARKVKEFKIQKALEAVQEKHEKIIQHKFTLSMHVKDISGKKAVLKTQINKTCREALNNIRKIERKAKEELGNLFRPEEDIIQTSINDCTAICKRLEETIHTSKDILRNTNDIDVLIICNDIIKQTACESEDFQLPLEKIPDLQITWKESEMKLLVEKNSNHYRDRQKRRAVHTRIV